MKKAGKTTGNMTTLVSMLTENQVLSLDKMKCVRGGDGDGGTPIIIPPPIKN